MPNASSILSPVNIHGLGRSGTTLVQNILSSTGFIQVCNETQSIVFGGYRSGELLDASHDKETIGFENRSANGVTCVHTALMALLSTRKTMWCQKVGGIPNFLNLELIIEDIDREHAGKRSSNFPFQWYWNVLNTCFPFAKNILILRDFRDVAVSRHQFSGYDPHDTAIGIETYAKILTWPKSSYAIVIEYNDLVSNPAQTIEAIVNALGISYDPSYLRALQWHAVPTKNRSLAQSLEQKYNWSLLYESHLGRDLSSRLESLYQTTLESLKRS